MAGQELETVSQHSKALPNMPPLGMGCWGPSSIGPLCLSTVQQLSGAGMLSVLLTIHRHPPAQALEDSDWYFISRVVLLPRLNHCPSFHLCHRGFLHPSASEAQLCSHCLHLHSWGCLLSDTESSLPARPFLPARCSEASSSLLLLLSA